MRIALSIGGGDAPGLNAVIRARRDRASNGYFFWGLSASWGYG
jgi:6-phosphofructokinase